MAGDDVTVGSGPRSKDDYRKVNVDARAGTGEVGGDLITSRLPVGADAVVVTYPSATQEVYTYKTGGTGGTTVATLTVNYTNGTKEAIADLAWT